MTHCGRLASGSAAIISAVTPGGKTALRRRLDVNRRWPVWFWLNGYMPIWPSTARARPSIPACRAAKLRRKRGHVGRHAQDVEEASGFSPVPSGADEQVLPARRLGGRAELMDHVGENVDDLDRPVMALWDIGRRLDDSRLQRQVGEACAVYRSLFGVTTLRWAGDM